MQFDEQIVSEEIYRKKYYEKKKKKSVEVFILPSFTVGPSKNHFFPGIRSSKVVKESFLMHFFLLFFVTSSEFEQFLNKTVQKVLYRNTKLNGWRTLQKMIMIMQAQFRISIHIRPPRAPWGPLDSGLMRI